VGVAKRKKPPVNQLIGAYARKLGLDPRAVRAVAMGEGGIKWGAVGDGGHAFGPFQMNDAGGVLTGRFGSSAARAAYANSPQGVLEAMTAMSRVAKGMRGQAAINAIVRKYERPADPNTSVSRALARYGSMDPSMAAANLQVGGRMANKPVFSRAPVAAAPGGGGRQALLGYLMGSMNAHITGEAPPNILETLQDMTQDTMPSAGIPPSGFTVDTADRQIPRVGKSGGYGGAKGAKAAIAAIRQAQRMGLRVGENPYVDKVDPVHTSGSHHYQNYPGKYGGKTVGKAIDVSGNPKAMNNFFGWLEKNRKRIGINDLFYDPRGYSYDRGSRWGKTIGGHSDHVHASFF
jgi:hypothetical protein